MGIVDGVIAFDGKNVTFSHNGCEVTVELELDTATGRLRPRKITVESAEGVTGEAMRTLPMRQVEALINRRYARPDEPSPPIRLRVPKGTGKKPDDFYRQVAAAYEFLALTSRAPAAEIARKNRVPMTTAHRWVREARARGLLPPGQKGKST
jgi:hypothetical protein